MLYVVAFAYMPYKKRCLYRGFDLQPSSITKVPKTVPKSYDEWAFSSGLRISGPLTRFACFRGYWSDYFQHALLMPARRRGN